MAAKTNKFDLLYFPDPQKHTSFVLAPTREKLVEIFTQLQNDHAGHTFHYTIARGLAGRVTVWRNTKNGAPDNARLIGPTTDEAAIVAIPDRQRDQPVLKT